MDNSIVIPKYTYSAHVTAADLEKAIAEYLYLHATAGRPDPRWAIGAMCGHYAASALWGKAKCENGRRAFYYDEFQREIGRRVATSLSQMHRRGELQRRGVRPSVRSSKVRIEYRYPEDHHLHAQREDEMLARREEDKRQHDRLIAEHVRRQTLADAAPALLRAVEHLLAPHVGGPPNPATCTGCAAARDLVSNLKEV